MDRSRPRARDRWPAAVKIAARSRRSCSLARWLPSGRRCRMRRRGAHPATRRTMTAPDGDVSFLRRAPGRRRRRHHRVEGLHRRAHRVVGSSFATPGFAIASAVARRRPCQSARARTCLRRSWRRPRRLSSRSACAASTNDSRLDRHQLVEQVVHLRRSTVSPAPPLRVTCHLSASLAASPAAPSRIRRCRRRGASSTARSFAS